MAGRSEIEPSKKCFASGGRQRTEQEYRASERWRQIVHLYEFSFPGAALLLSRDILGFFIIYSWLTFCLNKLRTRLQELALCIAWEAANML